MCIHNTDCFVEIFVGFTVSDVMIPKNGVTCSELVPKCSLNKKLWSSSVLSMEGSLLVDTLYYRRLVMYD